jgi:ubiquinone biosynthesis protein Coq4
MINLKQFYQSIQTLKNSKNLGDGAILKADALGAKFNPEVQEKMQAVIGYYPQINLDQLSKLPDGTLGKEYARHLQEKNLKPFNVSSDLKEMGDKNIFALRYAVTHDIFHVLLGFDTSYAGEIGVLAFAAEQNYSKSLKISLWFARILYPILAPIQLKQILENIRKGKEMGRKAKFLLGYRFEDNWQRPLGELKAELGIM